MKKMFLVFLLLLTIGCGQSNNTPQTLPTVAAVATLPPLPEGANGVVVGGDGTGEEAAAEVPVVEETAVPPEEPIPAEEVITDPAAVEEAPFSDTATHGYTYQRADGNRMVLNASYLPEIEPIDLPLNGTPQWVTAVSDGTDIIWAVVLQDGSLQAFRSNSEAVIEVTDLLSVASLGSTPPLLYVNEGNPDFVVAPSGNAGETYPAVLSDGRLAYTLPEGGVVVGDTTLDVNALPDGRILVDDQDRLLLLSDPTNRYAHGVLGDELEAGSITLIATQPETAVVNTITIPEPQVIEGIMPLWVDWNLDGQREIIVTVSDANQGAQIVMFNEAGEQIAAGPTIGQGGQWRHQIAVAPFGPNGEWELAAVLTPHLGGVVEFYRWNGSALEIVAEQTGFTSHVINTNNLDMAAAGDFNGDGRFELLLPTQDRTALGGIQRTEGGAEAIYQLPIGGQMVTNLAAAKTLTGQTAVAVGRDDGVLRIWQP